MSDCSRGSWLTHGQHRFEARYDEIRNGLAPTNVQGGDADTIRALLYRRVYIHDICTRCGAVVKRANTETP